MVNPSEVVRARRTLSWASETGAVLWRTDQVTISLQPGVVRDPRYLDTSSILSFTSLQTSPVERPWHGREETLHGDPSRQPGLLVGHLHTPSGLHQRLKAGVVLSREVVEDTYYCQAVIVTDSLAQLGVLGVVVDEVELQRKGPSLHEMLRPGLGGVAPVEVELGEDVAVLQSSTYRQE